MGTLLDGSWRRINYLWGNLKTTNLRVQNFHQESHSSNHILDILDKHNIQRDMPLSKNRSVLLRIVLMKMTNHRIFCEIFQV